MNKRLCFFLDLVSTNLFLIVTAFSCFQSSCLLSGKQLLLLKFIVLEDPKQGSGPHCTRHCPTKQHKDNPHHRELTIAAQEHLGLSSFLCQSVHHCFKANPTLLLSKFNAAPPFVPQCPVQCSDHIRPTKSPLVSHCNRDVVLKIQGPRAT